MDTYLIVDECILYDKYVNNKKKSPDEICEEIKDIAEKHNIPRENVYCVGISTNVPVRRGFKAYREKKEWDYIFGYEDLVRYCKNKAPVKNAKQNFKDCMGRDENIMKFLLDGSLRHPLQSEASDLTIRQFAESLAKEDVYECHSRVVILSHDRDEELESRNACVDRLAIKSVKYAGELLDEINKKLAQFLRT